MFDVVEKFVSINGEGILAGQLAVFIRFKGCNLNCTYCDTKWANKTSAESKKMSIDDIYSYIKETKVNNVTLTGGEPLFRDGIVELVNRLLEDKAINVEIETNGSIDVGILKDLSRKPSITMDYKLGASGMERHMFTGNFEYLGQKDTVKFVVGSEVDLERSKEIIDKYNLAGKCNLYLSPVFGSIEPAEIVEFMKDNFMNDVNLQIQMHKIIWDPNKRGV